MYTPLDALVPCFTPCNAPAGLPVVEGFGQSAGRLRDVNIQVGSTQLIGKATSETIAYRFLGGIRAYVTKKVFLFGEYKYFAANYTWRSEGGEAPAIHQSISNSRRKSSPVESESRSKVAVSFFFLIFHQIS